MTLIKVAGAPPDANDGKIGKLDYPIGNRTYGQRVFLSGQEHVAVVRPPRIQWQAHESITVSSTALQLTAGLRKQAEIAVITVESNTIRFWMDGVAPTATVGHTALDGDMLTCDGYWELEGLWMIRKDAADATIRVSYGVWRED